MIYVIAATLSLAAITIAIGHKAWQNHRIYHFHEEG